MAKSKKQPIGFIVCLETQPLELGASYDDSKQNHSLWYGVTATLFSTRDKAKSAITRTVTDRKRWLTSQGDRKATSDPYCHKDNYLVMAVH